MSDEHDPADDPSQSPLSGAWGAGALRAPTDVVRALTSAGMFCYLGWILVFFRQVERVVRVSSQPFAGVWDQRIEVLSFMVLPPNILILIPAAACAITATWLAGPSQELDLAILLRLVRWSANLQGAIAIASAVSIIFNDNGSPTQIGDTGTRVAGLAFCIAISRLSKAAEASNPAAA